MRICPCRILPEIGRDAICLVALMLGMTSCLEQYSIVGNTSLPAFDGKTLYLKTRTPGGMRSVDSCEVIHGQFNFGGKIDSTYMAELVVDDRSIMPVVIENGKISIDISWLDQKATGGLLNEKLYTFFEEKSRLDAEMENAANDEVRLMMRGMMPFEAERLCRERAEKISDSADSLVVEFIKNNYDNVLGPEVFCLISSRYRYPVITPQIRQVVDGAPRKFLNNPYVKEYLGIAKKNMAILESHSPSGGDFYQEMEDGFMPLQVKKK